MAIYGRRQPQPPTIINPWVVRFPPAVGGSGGKPILVGGILRSSIVQGEWGNQGMSVRSAQSVTVDFTTRRFDTGAAVNADSLPTGKLVVNGTDDAATVTVTNKATGSYKAAVTLPTLALGDVVQLRIAATVNSISDNGIIWTDSKDLAIDSAGIVDSNLSKHLGTAVLAGNTAGVPIVDHRNMVRVGTCQAGSTSSTIKLDGSASSTADFYKYLRVSIIGGTGAGQGGRVITSYASGGSKIATITPNWTTTPDNTSIFALESAGVDIETVLGATTGVSNFSDLITNTIFQRYMALLSRSDAAVATDLSTELGKINQDFGTGVGTYNNTTDSSQAIRDQGDIAWITATSVNLNAGQHVIVDSGTVTNLTNAPTAGDFTAAMKTSLNNATPTVTVSDKTGFVLAVNGLTAIASWDVDLHGRYYPV